MVNREPRAPHVFKKMEKIWENVFGMYDSFHGPTRWKRTLVHLFPNLGDDPAYFERLYRYVYSYLVNYCDQAHRSSHKDRAVMVVVLFHGIKRLRETEMLDPAVTDHLQLALQGRLKIFCSRIFGFDASKRIMCDKEYMLAAMVGSMPDLSSCLPPHYRRYSHGFNIPGLMDSLIEIVNISLTSEIPEDRLNHLANNYRFAHILRSIPDFQNSEREGETDAADWIYLSLRFSLWLAEKWNSSEIDDFDRVLIEIHAERIKAESIALDNIDASSDQDDCSDELEIVLI